MMRFVDLLYTLPFMFFVILLVAYFGRSLILLFVALGAVQWLTMSRIVRGQVLSLKAQPFVEAARALGASDRRIIFRHILPNLAGPIIVYATLTVPTVILEEAFLSFLGLGVSPPRTSWGLLAAEGAQAISIVRTNWWLVVFPGTALALTLLSLNFVGDGLREAFDPRHVRGR
jgi:oligopeptide transport system permease protein